MASLDKIESV
jgi:hypothetical protein